MKVYLIIEQVFDCCEGLIGCGVKKIYSNKKSAEKYMKDFSDDIKEDEYVTIKIDDDDYIEYADGFDNQIGIEERDVEG